MKIAGTTALVTGANRGIGKALVEALLQAGAAKIYAATRDGVAAFPGNARLVPLTLDITKPAQVAAAVQAAGDVHVLINNAGVNRNAGLLHAASLDGARAEMETNYFGTLAMCRAFAPVLARSGGGAIVNILSIAARVNLPFMGSLCASKAAGLSMTQGVRAELAKSGTRVVAVMPGAVDTRMTAGVDVPKMQPADVARAVLEALEAGQEDIYPGDMASGMAAGLAADPKAVEKQCAAYLPRQ